MQTGENANPIMPLAWDAATVVAGVLVAALLVAALISIIRNKNQPPVAVALWILVVFAVPVLGPLLWFFAGRRSAQTSRTVS